MHINNGAFLSNLAIFREVQGQEFYRREFGQNTDKLMNMNAGRAIATVKPGLGYN